MLNFRINSWNIFEIRRNKKIYNNGITVDKNTKLHAYNHTTLLQPCAKFELHTITTRFTLKCKTFFSLTMFSTSALFLIWNGELLVIYKQFAPILCKFEYYMPIVCLISLLKRLKVKFTQEIYFQKSWKEHDGKN